MLCQQCVLEGVKCNRSVVLEGVKCKGSIVLEGNVPAVCAGGSEMKSKYCAGGECYASSVCWRE